MLEVNSMENCSEPPVDGPIRSRFRGLSWDKKHQGWRVRLYYNGKQRHVGRYEDDLTAAKAYDKSAYYLYGANAITNFGLEACLADITEVSPFILLAKEQAEQEQQAKGQQQRLHRALSEQYLTKRQQQPMANSPLPEQLLLPLQQQLLHHNMAVSQQQQQLHTLQQQQAYAGARSIRPAAVPQANSSTQPVLLAGQEGMVAPPPVATGSSFSCMTSAPAMAAAAVLSGFNAPGLNSSSSSYVICSTPSGQHVLVPVVNNAKASFATFSLDQQQQQQQQQQMLFFGDGSSQTLQLSMQPQLTSIAAHMSAAAATAQHPAQQPQWQQLQQLQDLAMSMPMTFTVSGPEISLPMDQAAVQAGTAAAALATTMPMCLNLPACGGDPAAGSAACPGSFLGGMLSGLHGYPAAAAAAERALTPLPQMQHHAGAVLEQGARGSSSFVDCGSGSGSGSQMLPAAGLLVSSGTPGFCAAPGSSQQHSLPGMGVVTALGMGVAPSRSTASPTFSSSSNGSSNSHGFDGSRAFLF